MTTTPDNDAALLHPDGMREAIAASRAWAYESLASKDLNSRELFEEELHQLNARLLAAKVAWRYAPERWGNKDVDIEEAERLLHEAFKDLER